MTNTIFNKDRDSNSASAGYSLDTEVFIRRICAPSAKEETQTYTHLWVTYDTLLDTDEVLSLFTGILPTESVTFSELTENEDIISSVFTSENVEELYELCLAGVLYWSKVKNIETGTSNKMIRFYSNEGTVDLLVSPSNLTFSIHCDRHDEGSPEVMSAQELHDKLIKTRDLALEGNCTYCLLSGTDCREDSLIPDIHGYAIESVKAFCDEYCEEFEDFCSEDYEQSPDQDQYLLGVGWEHDALYYFSCDASSTGDAEQFSLSVYNTIIDTEEIEEPTPIFAITTEDSNFLYVRRNGYSCFSGTTAK